MTTIPAFTRRIESRARHDSGRLPERAIDPKHPRCLLRAVLLFVVVLLTQLSPVHAARLWDDLTQDEQNAVLAKLQGLIKEDLENDDARFVRNTWDVGDEGESEADDPLAKLMMKQLAELDGPALAQAAGSLSTGDAIPLRNYVISAAAAEGGEAAKDWAVKRFEKDGVGRLLFKTLADQTDGLKALLASLLDPRKSWCDVANVALEESRKAVLAASQKSAEEIAKKSINWVVGDGPFSAVGATPGDAYLMLLALDAEYFRALPRRLGAQAGGRFYDEYERARNEGKSPDAAFDEIDPWLATSDGRWFVELAGSVSGAREALERCYGKSIDATRATTGSFTTPRPRSSTIPSSSSIQILHCVDRQVEEKRDEGWTKLCGETQSAGGPARDLTAQKLVWITETLRRLTEEQLAARGAATLAETQKLADRAKARLSDLERLSAEETRLCERSSLEAIASGGTTAFAALDALSERNIDVEIAIERLPECAKPTPPAPDPPPGARANPRRRRSRHRRARSRARFRGRRREHRGLRLARSDHHRSSTRQSACRLARGRALLARRRRGTKRAREARGARRIDAERIAPRRR